VLRPELAAVIGAERFLSEIKTTANLQHPHILPLFDSGEAGTRESGAGTFLYYVMPYVEGESLRDRLTREKQLPIADAVRIASEVASALDYAHRQGVIHRDIKPENILLHDGRALVADFGIALAASKAGGTRMTETGMSLGTPHYMSPEQAMGEREITARSDVYALGCVLYEMLLGEPPFTGPTAQAIVAKVMTAEPAALSAQRKSIPPAVEDAVLTALEKLPADRFASAAEFADALGGGKTPSMSTRAVRAKPPARPVALLALLAATAAIAALAIWGLLRQSSSAGPTVYDAALPDSAPMTFGATTLTTSYGASFRNLSLAPAGDFAIYAARQGDSTSLWYRSLRDGSVRPIAGTRGAVAPRISPDGSRVAFLLGDRVMVAPVSGGEPRTLLDGLLAMSGEWISPTQLLVIDTDGNRANWLDPEGGTSRSKPIPRCVYGKWDPDARQLLCGFNRTALLVDPESGDRWTVRAVRPDGAPGGPLEGTAFRVVDKTYLAYLSPDGNLVAARYDPVAHLVQRPVTMLVGVRREAIGETQYDIAANGTLLYAPGVDATLGRIVVLHPGGMPQPLLSESADYQRYDLSRNRRWFAAAVQATEGTELRIYDLQNGQRAVWLRAEQVRHPLWSADGERLLVAVRDSTRWNILAGSPSSGAPPDTVASFEADPSAPDPIDYHDDHLALAQDWGRSITMRFDPSAAHPVFDTVLTGARFASLAPGGRLIAYQSLEGSRIIVTTFPVAGRRWQLASEGVEPIWLSTTEVLYRSGVAWYLAHINPETGEPAGAATSWVRDPRFSDTSGWSNRPSHDGGIIYVEGPSQTTTSYLRVVPNWVAQMKAAVDAANR
jgi:serine/threonine-protein kinase